VLAIELLEEDVFAGGQCRHQGGTKFVVREIVVHFAQQADARGAQSPYQLVATDEALAVDIPDPALERSRFDGPVRAARRKREQKSKKCADSRARGNDALAPQTYTTGVFTGLPAKCRCRFSTCRSPIALRVSAVALAT
jgi:hypothetical protein